MPSAWTATCSGRSWWPPGSVAPAITPSSLSSLSTEWISEALGADIEDLDLERFPPRRDAPLPAGYTHLGHSVESSNPRSRNCTMWGRPGSRPCGAPSMSADSRSTSSSEEFLTASLIYSAIASLDGYVEDEHGNFDWAAPDEEVHAFVNDLERPVGTHLYGRRMYETMVYWETDDDQAAVTRDFAEIWRAADKVVYSRTLRTVSSERTRIEREFDAATIRRLKESSPSDVTIGGAELAGHAIAEGLVDECHLFLAPVLVGGGKRALPAGVQAEVRLLDERRFGSGVVYLHYRL
jgi:dihydrofolate reductase